MNPYFPPNTFNAAGGLLTPGASSPPTPGLSTSGFVPVVPSGGTNSFPAGTDTSLQVVEPAQFSKYCSFATSERKAQIIAASNEEVSISLTPMPVGTPIVLSALIPSNTNILHGSPDNLGLPARSLPSNSVIEIQWKIKHVDNVAKAEGLVKCKNTDFKSGDTNKSKEAKASTSLTDVTGSLQVLSSNDASTVLGLVPWPDSTVADGKLIDVTVKDSKRTETCRVFQATLHTKIWWPGFPDKVAPKPNETPVPYDITGDITLVPFELYFAVENWSTALSDLKQIDSKSSVHGLQFFTNDMTTELTQFRDLFSVTSDTLNPAAGAVATITAQATDKSSGLSGRVKEIVHSVPNVRLQAAVDLSGPLTNIVNTVASLFQSTPASGAMTAAQVNIDKVLSSLMSVPIAVEINGASTAKTIEPNAVELPSMASVGDGKGLMGQIPVGNLTTILHTTEEALTIDKNKIKGIAKMERQGPLSLTVLPLPEIISISDPEVDIPEPSKLTLDLTLVTNLLLPGANQPVKLEFNLGSLNITRPAVPIPQCMFLTRYSLLGARDKINEVLMVRDPWTARIFPSLSSMLERLQLISNVVNKIVRVFKLADLTVKADDIGKERTRAYAYLTELGRLSDNLSMILDVLKQVGVTKILLVDFPKTGIQQAWINLAKLSPPWYSGVDVPENVTSALWLGSTRLSETVAWRLSLYSPKFPWVAGHLHFPSRSSTVPQFSALLGATDLCFEKDDGGHYSSPQDFNENFTKIACTFDVGHMPVTNNPYPAVRKKMPFRYYLLKNTSGYAIDGRVWRMDEKGDWHQAAGGDRAYANQERQSELDDNTKQGQVCSFGCTVVGLVDVNPSWRPKDYDFVYDPESTGRIICSYRYVATQTGDIDYNSYEANYQR